MAFLLNRLLLVFLTFVPSILVHSSLVMKPTFDSDLIYMDSILGDDYVDSISKPIDFLGFEVGARMATPLQITNLLKTWETQTDRLKVVEYARSHENRPLHAVFISSSKNLDRLDEIKSGQLEKTSELIEKASRINKVDPETFKLILKKFLY